MKKKVIIIGGGVAGLSAGIYGQENGYDTEIIEMHTVPGGRGKEKDTVSTTACTGWSALRKARSTAYGKKRVSLPITSR